MTFTPVAVDLPTVQRCLVDQGVFRLCVDGSLVVAAGLDPVLVFERLLAAAGVVSPQFAKDLADVVAPRLTGAGFADWVSAQQHWVTRPGCPAAPFCAAISA